MPTFPAQLEVRTDLGVLLPAENERLVVSRPCSPRRPLVGCPNRRTHCPDVFQGLRLPFRRFGLQVRGGAYLVLVLAPPKSERADQVWE